jgi:hypothetical protein
MLAEIARKREELECAAREQARRELERAADKGSARPTPDTARAHAPARPAQR